jgi:cob(I)alamin adenosyltransferase
VPQAAQRVLATFADLQKLRVNTTQEFLAKSESSISKRMSETRGYLEFVVDMAEKQLSQQSISKVMVRLAEKALCIMKRWNKLQRKLRYWGSVLSVFSKPLACQTFDMVSGII